MQPEQKISMPSQADLRRLDEQREVCTRYLGDENSVANYQNSSAGKLGLLRALLSANVFSPEQTYELQCMGVILGDVFVQELRMEWITVEDEYGRDPAVRLPSTSIILYPTTMISKRVEAGEMIDVFDLFNGFAAEIERIAGQR